MIIQSIQKGKKHTVVLTLSTGEEISLYKDYFLSTTLKTGDEITSEQLCYHKQRSQNSAAVSRAAYYLSNGDLSRKKLIEKLKNAGFEQDCCIFAANKMESYGYINDQKLAKKLCGYYLNNQNLSLFETKQKLILKGFDSDTVKYALEQFEVDPVEQIKNIILKKYSAALDNPDKLKKAFAALQRHGFRYSDIKSALKEFTDDIFTED